jgi:hypothetical protein
MIHRYLVVGTVVDTPVQPSGVPQRGVPSEVHRNTILNVMARNEESAVDRFVAHHEDPSRLGWHRYVPRDEVRVLLRWA